MLRSLNELYGYRILATDDDIGKAHDFLFDDKDWVIRHLVVDTGKWLPGRLVIISPAAMRKPDWTNRQFPVNLSKSQIENSPSIAEDEPVSRQKERAVHTYYGWPAYWGGSAHGDLLKPGGRETMSERDQEAEMNLKESTDGDPHLRSSREVKGYFIQAVDDRIGHVDDFIVDDENWQVSYIVVDTKNWMPWGKRVLIPPEWIKNVKWADFKVYVNVTKEQVENSPEYDPDQPVNKEYETQLYDYYGRPKK